ncbi:TOR1 [Mytilus coruscus]|uniref:TOR1 n=1 Tax=Mytilus coruscus TaxID=42192 RepID=A0A6J8EX52_MYTCO|nr:TOR1 [Mytilus coruscus]
MGNFIHGSSCMKVDSVSKDNIDTASIDIDGKNSKLDSTFKATDSGHKTANTEKTNTQPNESQNDEEFSKDTQNTNLNDANFGSADVTPRNIDVRGVDTSDRQQNNSSLCNDNDNASSSALKDCQETDTEQHSHSLHRNVRATLGTYDDQKSQITAVGTTSKWIQTVHHTHQYNINVEINNPSANALIIGNDNIVNVTKKEREKQPLIEHIKDGSTNIKYTRKNLDEVSFIHQQKDGSEDAFKASVIEKVAGNINIGCEKLRRSRSEVSYRRPKSFRHFTTQRSSTVDPRTMLRNLQWNQYEMIQETLLRTVSCEIKKCESEETLAKKIAEIKFKFQNTVDQLNDQLRKSVMKTGHANERIIAGLNNKGKIVLSDANDKLLELEKNRIQDLHSIPLSTSHEIRSTSDREKMTNYAKELQSIILEKVTSHVSNLLPLKIQQFIIVFTFECQKSFVLKQMMVDFVRSEVSSIMKYILNPNEYAKNWLITFTEQNIFYKKRPNKPHIYAKMAKKEVENIFDDLKSAIASTKHRKGEINNLSDWAKFFLQNLKSMPLSSKDLGDFQSLSNVSVKEFIDLFSSNLESMKREIITNFKNTTIYNVQWTDNPYNKIIECLWGCTECCPFCHEPCQYSDIEHVTQGNNHKCIQHRPLGVYGFMNEDNHMIMLENCNSLIKSSDRYFRLRNKDDPLQCSNYDQAFIGWDIRPVVAADECKYWKWVMCNRKDQLQQLFSANTNNIPEEWNSVTEEEAIRLSGNLVEKVHGQHIAVRAVRSYINNQMLDKDPKKALSLSFHGGPGTGKTYMSSIIAESIYGKGLKSKYVHLISATHHFPDKENIKQYKEFLANLIIDGVKQCERSLFIFDEVDKMPKGLMDRISPYMDYNAYIDGVDYRKAIFVFLSKDGARALNFKTLDHSKKGLDRKSLELKYMEHLIKTDANSIGFSKSRLFSAHLITAYIPFLPLEKQHVKECIRDQLKSKKCYDTDGDITDEIVENITKELYFYPDDNPIFSTTGSKRVPAKVDFVMNKN